MEIREYDGSDPESAEAGRLVLDAVRAAETPWLPPLTSHKWLMEVRNGFDGTPERHFLASVDETVVGHASLEFGEWDNLDLAWASVFVLPQHRRNGYGSTMLEHLMDLAREHGSRSFGATGWELPGLEAFAEHHGMRLGNYTVHRVQHLDQLTAGLVDEIHAEAMEQANGYELLRMVAPSPNDMLPALAELTAAINDAPIGTLDIEDENFPVERIREYERTQLESGRRLYRVVAREKSSGRLAGHTIVVVDPDLPHVGDQHDTSVQRADRGHRLGLLLKTDMLRWLAEVEPQLERIDTWNDEENDHMIDVNERLGYRMTSRELEFQRDL